MTKDTVIDLALELVRVEADLLQLQEDMQSATSHSSAQFLTRFTALIERQADLAENMKLLMPEGGVSAG